MSEQEKTDKNAELLSPYVIVNNNYYFEIPLYQRIFEWEEENIKRLLQDLWTQYNRYNSHSKKYYIGAFTCINKSPSNESPLTFELLDGQQRITALMIIASVLKEKAPNWNEFIKKNEKFRIHYVSRPKDEDKLKELCGLGDTESQKSLNTDNSSDDISRMKRCKDGVEEFLKEKGDKLKEFSEYIYHNLTIIKTSLPADYTHQDIFQYFDRFNTPSPNLENYEIVKFKLLEGLGEDQKLYTKLLEAAMNMDKCLIRKRTNKENNESINTRFSNAISFACDLGDPKHEFLTNYGDSTLNDVYLTNDEIKDNNDEETKDTVSSFSDFSKLLNELLKNKTKGYESKEEEEKENNNFFSTPFFMLLTLYIMVFKPSENEIENYGVTKFFDKNKIIETFNHFFPEIVKPEDGQCKKKEFIRQLVLYRLLLDKYFIIKDKDKDEHYNLNSELLNTDDSAESKEKLKQYEAMLFYSHYEGNYYKWLQPFLTYIKDKINENEVDKVKAETLLTELKRIDNNNIGDDSVVKQQISEFKNNQNINNLNALTYGNIDRYWFYRLDYYLWESALGKQVIQNDNNLDNFIKKYYFRPLRSIEHVDPQNPNRKDHDQNQLSEGNKFGNLALISSSTNSGLGRKSFHQKIGKIKDRIQNGTYIIESLKLLHIFTYNKWNDQSSIEHTKQMINVLINSFDDVNNDVWENRKLELTNLFNGEKFEKNDMNS